MQKLFFAFLFFLFLTPLYAQDACPNDTTYQAGAGIYDITGPAAEMGMMGYGMIDQTTAGIYQRLWARAFVIESPCNGKRVAIVNTDLGMVFQGIKQQVIVALQKKYGLRYSDDNVLLTAIHTHSGPGGFSTYNFYNLTTFGFNRKNFDTIVNGIVTAIDRAEANLAPAHIKLASADLPGISHNRSPTAYLLNPVAERDQYTGDFDIEMNLLRFERLDGTPFATLNWFPLHGVSINNKNRLINGDNKGYAEYLLEKEFHSDYGPTAFVAAFAQANAGDVSPNPLGHEGGMGQEGLRLAEQAGLPQYQLASRLLREANLPVSGSIDYKHQYVTMNDVTVSPPYTDGGIHQTCPAAIGVSMLAGTQDGEGVGRQGVTCDSVTNVIEHFICEKSRTDCQGVKPIALSTGTMWPYPWTPNVLPMQVVQLGNIIIVAAPFELTTMTGRRIRAAVSKYFPDKKIVIAALANAYSGYVATNDEYQLQRYEAASTHFGPWTQAALTQQLAVVAKALANGETIDAGPTPPDLLGWQVNMRPGVIYDAPPNHKKMGDVETDVQAQYHPGDLITVSFWGGHPANNYRTQTGFLAVQQWQNGEWQTIRHDWDWDTEYHWQRSGLASSLITIVWRTDVNTAPGKYRIVHYGDAKEFWSQKVVPYIGYSSEFIIA